MAVLEDLQHVAALHGGEDREPPVVENENLGPGDGLQHTGMTAVTPGDGERLEQPWHTVVDHGASVTAGLVSERTGDPALSKAGGPSDQQVLVPVDPAAIDQLGHDGAVEAARVAAQLLARAFPVPG